MGWGCHFLLRQALQISLAEAWERLVVANLANKAKLDIPFTHVGYAAHVHAKKARELAERECLERYLLFLAAKGTVPVHKVKTMGWVEKLLAWKIEKTSGPISIYQIESKLGKALFAGTHRSKLWCFDSVFLTPNSRQPIRKLFYSLMSSGEGKLLAIPKQFAGSPLVQRSRCSSLVSKILYPGAQMPAVAVAYIGGASERNAERLTQDELFASLICQANQSS